MNITVTGASGLIGRRLIARLGNEGHRVHILTRAPRTGLPPALPVSIWDAANGPPPPDSLLQADAIVHLAGETVAQRWTADVKRRIRSSRVDGTRWLVRGLAGLQRRPAVLLAASAIGFYGDRGEEVLTESSSPGEGFLPEVCQAWETEALAAADLGMRVVLLRFGIVLSKEGGALARMLPAFRTGLGGRLGSGEQWMSWIHLDDAIGLTLFALTDASLRGPVNATSPNPARNADFTRALGRALGRPAIIPVPAGAIRILFGEMSQMVLASQRVLPRAAQNAGYSFTFPELSAALRDLLA